VEVPVSLARSYKRCTIRLEQHLFRLTKDSTVVAVAKRMKLDWETVKDAEVRYVRGLLRKRNLDGITRIGIDEVSYQKRHKYLTLVTDLDGHRVVYATHGNDGAAIRRFIRWFGPKRCRRIKVAVTDCVFRRCRSLVPKEGDHRFRTMPITIGAKRRWQWGFSPIPEVESRSVVVAVPSSAA
jgi:transposase